MTSPTEPSDEPQDGAKSRAAIIKIAVPLVLVLLAAYFFWPSASTDDGGTTFAVRKGTLPITVIEGGTVEALESQIIKSEVRGTTKILSIVEEGYLVKAADIDAAKVLVTLDDSELREQLTQAEIEYQNAVSLYTDANEQLGIQLKQNESDIRAAELAIKFARMDFERYLGADLASRIVSDLKLDEAEAAILTAAEEALSAESIELPEVSSSAGDEPQQPEFTQEMAEKLAVSLAERGMEVTADQILERAEKDDQGRAIVSGRLKGRLEALGFSFDIPPVAVPLASKPEETVVENEGANVSVDLSPRSDIDFSSYLGLESLQEGEAKQSLRKLMDDQLLSEEELVIAQNRLDGTERLAEKDFVTQSELETDMMKVRRGEINQDASTTALDLFIKYEFPKQSELYLSDYEEALRMMERTHKLAISKLAQAQAKLRSTEAQYNLKTQRRDELIEQIEKCTIVAERPGLVVYGGGNNRYSRDEQIQEGATVRERQEIITIPDMTEMGVTVKIHESSIKMIEPGQRARIVVDAYPEDILNGEVVKVSVLPDSGDRWMNPDLKVYKTQIAIDGVHDWLKPGMNAETTILVDVLEDITYVPVQAVMISQGEKVCYVDTGRGPEKRIVETGKFNNEFIEVISGLNENEGVFLRRPEEFQFEEEDILDESGEGTFETGSLTGWGNTDAS